jgi:multidrug efflux pump subunit AcrA (membrane-fusion protein)
VDRGDISVPITAPGLIEPNQRFEVKSKASGEVTEIRVKEGDYVRKGEELIKLDPDEEGRNLERAKADLAVAEAQLESARLSIEEREAAVEGAKASLAALMAEFPVIKADNERAKNLRRESGGWSEIDLMNLEGRYNRSLADQDSAKARIKQSENAVEAAKVAVKQQEQTIIKFQQVLDDAQERVADTTIEAPADGIVTDVRVTVGAKIQSGTQSLTGGTALLEMADISVLKVVARVDEANYGRVVNISPDEALPEVPSRERTIQQDAEMIQQRSGVVKLTVDAFANERFQGRIVRVEPQGRQNAGASVVQFNVHVEVTSDDAWKLPLGAQAQVEFTIESVKNVLRVPNEAIKNLAGRNGVWKKVAPPPGEPEAGKEFVECDLGITNGEFTEVLKVEEADALKVGDEVYTKLPREVDGDRN